MLLQIIVAFEPLGAFDAIMPTQPRKILLCFRLLVVCQMLSRLQISVDLVKVTAVCLVSDSGLDAVVGSLARRNIPSVTSRLFHALDSMTHDGGRYSTMLKYEFVNADYLLDREEVVEGTEQCRI